MKKLINDPDNVVADALVGLELAHPELRVDHANRVVFRGDAPRQGKVGLVSGGGSGHEPLHGGFVGLGMLDAAIAGEVFTSPVPDQVMAATEGVDGGAGVLHIVKNYTGDVMNFEMAAEMAEGVEVVSVVTADDVAVQDSSYTVGRRGVGVTVFVEKLAGAAAEEGRSLAEVAALAKAVDDAGRSMGMALTSCTVPAAGKPTFDLPDDEMEIGIGIHGEPGRRRVPLAPASEVAEMLMTPLLGDLDFTGGPVIAMVNGMGGTPLIELYLMYGEVAKILQKSGITVARSLVGNYITSLDMAGCSVTLLKADDETVRLWDAPVNTAGPALGGLRVADGDGTEVDVAGLTAWLTAYADDVHAHRDDLTALDSAIGDADHGANLDRGMKAVVAKLADTSPPEPGPLLKATGMTLVSTVGGASGPLYGTLFLRMAAAAGSSATLDAAGFGAALRAGLEGVVARGKAEAGDKTMYDALAPACDAYDASVSSGGSLSDALAAAVSAAEAGRDATIPLVARKGRASYLGERSVGHQDPGATSVTMLVAAAARTLV